MLPLLVTPSNLRNALRASQNYLRVIETNMGDDFLPHYNKYVKLLLF
jgi:hypothetical protein